MSWSGCAAGERAHGRPSGSCTWGRTPSAATAPSSPARVCSCRPKDLVHAGRDLDDEAHLRRVLPRSVHETHDQRAEAPARPSLVAREVFRALLVVWRHRRRSSPGAPHAAFTPTGRDERSARAHHGPSPARITVYETWDSEGSGDEEASRTRGAGGFAMGRAGMDAGGGVRPRGAEAGMMTEHRTSLALLPLPRPTGLGH